MSNSMPHINSNLDIFKFNRNGSITPHTFLVTNGYPDECDVTTLIRIQNDYGDLYGLSHYRLEHEKDYQIALYVPILIDNPVFYRDDKKYICEEAKIYICKRFDSYYPLFITYQFKDVNDIEGRHYYSYIHENIELTIDCSFYTLREYMTYIIDNIQKFYI